MDMDIGYIRPLNNQYPIGFLQNAIRFAKQEGAGRYTETPVGIPIQVLNHLSQNQIEFYLMICAFKSRGDCERYEGFRSLTTIIMNPRLFNSSYRIHQNLVNFRQFSSLRFLDLSNNRFCGTIGDNFNNLKELEYLSLNDNEFEGKTSQIILNECKKLQKLFLGGNRLTDFEYERIQLRSTIPGCEVDFRTQSGKELLLHLTWVQIENKFYTKTGNLQEIEQFHRNEIDRYNREHLIEHSSAILDLNIFEDNEIQIREWSGHRDTNLERQFIEHANEIIKGFRPFVLVKHTQNSGIDNQVIKTFNDLTKAIRELDDDTSGKSMAVYDTRNGLDNIMEVKFKGVKVTHDDYNIENDFLEWINHFAVEAN